MKASPEHQRKLLDVQECDTKLARLARRQQQLPQRERLVQLEKETSAAKDSFMQAQRTLEDTQLEMKRLEADVALVMERLHRDESKLEASTSGKEASALTHELDTLKAREQQLEEVQFHVMERLDAEQQAFDAAQAELERLADEQKRVHAELESEEHDIALERVSIGERRAEIAHSISTELLELYEHTRERYGIGAALLRGNVSEGSNMALADAELVTLRETPADEIVFCQVSGCILVRTEDSAK